MDTPDPLVAAVDTETADLVLTRSDEVAPYVHRFDCLREELGGDLSRAAILEEDAVHSGQQQGEGDLWA
jgi:hypothetical protein